MTHATRRFLVYSDWQLRGLYRLAMLDEAPDGTTYAAQPICLSLTPLKEFEEVPAMAHLDQVAAESLMDALWRAGIRPTRRSNEEKAELEAVRDHLKDMRAFAFKKSGVVPPEYAGLMIVRGGNA